MVSLNKFLSRSELTATRVRYVAKKNTYKISITNKEITNNIKDARVKLSTIITVFSYNYK